MSLYTYNHTGERSLKRYGAFNTAYLNGAYAGSGLDGLTRYSAYVSPDHLGSTTHITDKGGNVVQYAAYTPYGALFREYKSVMPYKFNDSARREQNQATLGLCRTEACLRAKHNGKELDQETGYYYYGARYYDPSVALWIGVDPLAEKYPDVSPYVYCHGNPVRLIDPTGLEDIESGAMTDDKWHNFNSNSDQINLEDVVVQGENETSKNNSGQQLNRIISDCASATIEVGKQISSSISDSYKYLGETMERYVGDGYTAYNLGEQYHRLKNGLSITGNVLSVYNITSDIKDIVNNGKTLNNVNNLVVDALSATGLWGACSALMIDTFYRPVGKYVIDTYNHLNAKLNNIENWFNGYNFGF